MAEELIRQINPEARIVCDEQRLRPTKSEVERLLGCNKKIRELTDWEPRYTFEQGLAETIEFLKKNMDNIKLTSIMSENGVKNHDTVVSSKF